jgi:hypothetical protein
MASRYTILLDRTEEDDDPAAHGGATDGRRQVAAELRESIDATGLPVGVFAVTGREEIPDELVGDFAETLLERAERHLRAARAAPHGRLAGSTAPSSPAGSRTRSRLPIMPSIRWCCSRATPKRTSRGRAEGGPDGAAAVSRPGTASANPGPVRCWTWPARCPLWV